METNFVGIKNMSSSDYHASAALGSTDIKKAANLAKFKHQVIDKLSSAKESSAFDFGTCAHDVILEQTTERFLKGPQVSTKAVKEWKEFVAANPEKIVLTPDEYSRVMGIFDTFCSHEIANKLVSTSFAEQSFFSIDETGLWLKARPDLIAKSGEFLADYKTTISADIKDIQKSIINYGYHISAAHYMAVVESVVGKRPKEYFWIFQEKEAPYCLQVVKADESLLAFGERKRRELLNKISVAKESNFYPSYDLSIPSVVAPAWAEKAEEIDFEEAI